MSTHRPSWNYDRLSLLLGRADSLSSLLHHRLNRVSHGRSNLCLCWCSSNHHLLYGGHRHRSDRHRLLIACCSHTGRRGGFCGCDFGEVVHSICAWQLSSAVLRSRLLNDNTSVYEWLGFFRFQNHCIHIVTIAYYRFRIRRHFVI